MQAGVRVGLQERVRLIKFEYDGSKQDVSLAVLFPLGSCTKYDQSLSFNKILSC